MKYYIVVICLSIFFFFINGCEDEIDNSAKKVSLDDLIHSTTYYGFELLYNSYIPDDEIVNGIKNNFDTTKFKLIMFVSPSCYSCNKIDSLTPAITKALFATGIPEKFWEIYSIPSIVNDHPYKDVITLGTLPTYWILKDNIPYYSIVDTIHKVKEEFPDSILKVEKALLDGLN